MKRSSLPRWGPSWQSTHKAERKLNRTAASIAVVADGSVVGSTRRWNWSEAIAPASAPRPACHQVSASWCSGGPGGTQGARGDGGALVFLFETPDGSVLYQDTSGHWSGVLRDLRADVAILAAAGGGNVDGEPIQGSLAQFVARQVDLLRPRRVVLGHHDDWPPGFSIPADVEPIRSELSRVAPRCELPDLD